MKNDNSNNNGESKIREDSHKVRISDGSGSYARESYGDSYGKEIKKAFSVGSATPGPSGGGKKK